LVETTPPVRLRVRGRINQATETVAHRAALNAAHLLGIAFGLLLRDLRRLKDPLAEALARTKEAELSAKLAFDIVDLLSARLDKIPDRHRPYYTPSQRFRILEIKSLLGWSTDLTAKTFRVCPNTISNWERGADFDARTVGSTVKPTPPIVRLADVGRRLVQAMIRLGVGGEDLVAQTLARAGWKVSARSVRRIGRERHGQGPPPAPLSSKTNRPVIAHFAHHVWMMDVTVVRVFLGDEFHVAAVFDAFSRVPLAVHTFDRTPGAAVMARLLKAAAKAFGKPTYVITDRGGEFTGKVFSRAVGRLGIVQRFASVENIFATARLERFWRTLKATASLPLRPPLTIEDLERRLETTLTHYVLLRPHQGLCGATPAEAFLGREPARLRAESPPRGRPGQGPVEAPFTIDFLDRDQRAFPFLTAA
jgi:transposase InsO family protein